MKLSILLTMTCPECEETMHSTALLDVGEVNEEEPLELDLDEFAGMEFECECGFKVKVLNINPRDEKGDPIY